MSGSGGNITSFGNDKRKRLPVFSIVLISCYLIVSIWFITFGLNDKTGRETGSQPETQSSEPVFTAATLTETPTPTPTPEAPTPKPDPIPLPPAVQVKGLYIGAWFAGDKSKMDKYIEICETTEINSLVIDIKEDYGYVTFLNDNPALSITSREQIPNARVLVEELNERGIYTIARIVCFRDPQWGEKKPDLAFSDKEGNTWSDRGGTIWLNPYKRENWDYIAEVCLEAAKLGFKEVQLDYVRFPADGNLSAIDFGPEGEAQTKTEVIAEFVSFIRETMFMVGVRTSADVFGIIAISDRDADFIGQDFKMLLPNLDAISPMIYPSHFSNKQQNGIGQYINSELFEIPDKEPHGVVYHTLQHFIRQMDLDDPTQAIMRPFLQDFTASYLGQGNYITYGAKEVRAQIDAVYDAGFEEWILWNNISDYSIDAFKSSDP